ncbi:MAG: 1,6-anhydro-N-acetylmuramyl-L-alanine amidase AmpD [Pseudomonadota bacterium]|nr:1,6-anhydro-N-acetylmuramyl-L-alanine amidase AmpD [Pseudomonadota bacterium]
MQSNPDQAGWSLLADVVPSPNFNQRPDAARIELIVIHNISLPPRRFGSGAITQLFQNTLDAEAHPYFAQIAELKVSSHFLILRSGRILQFVNTDQRAWHAGLSSFKGREACNDFSIGIELEGADDMPYSQAQYAALIELISELKSKHPDLAYITGHEHIAPGRKTDPGIAFDWQGFESQLADNQLKLQVCL